MLPVLCVLKPNVHLPSLLFGAKFDLKQEIEYCLYARATLSFDSPHDIYSVAESQCNQLKVSLLEKKAHLAFKKSVCRSKIAIVSR